METKWYCIPHENEVGSYNIYEDGNTNFPRGVLLAYQNCCLVTGFNSKEEAIRGITKYPCKKYCNKTT